MKHLLLLALLLVVSRTMAQQEPVFKVSPHKNISLIPSLDTLLAGETYHFRVSGMPVASIEKATFANGTVQVNDTGISIHVNPTTSLGKKQSLQLFTKKDKILIVVFEKNFHILPVGEIPVFDPRTIYRVVGPE